jgi:hypothetical protein
MKTHADRINLPDLSSDGQDFADAFFAKMVEQSMQAQLEEGKWDASRILTLGNRQSRLAVPGVQIESRGMTATERRVNEPIAAAHVHIGSALMAYGISTRRKGHARMTWDKDARDPVEVDYQISDTGEIFIASAEGCDLETVRRLVLPTIEEVMHRGRDLFMQLFTRPEN